MEKSNKVLVTGVLSVVAVLSMLAFSSAANASMVNGIKYLDDTSTGSTDHIIGGTNWRINNGFWNLYKDSDGFYVRLGTDGIALKVSDWFFVKTGDATSTNGGTYSKITGAFYVKTSDGSYLEMHGNRLFRLDDGTLLYRQGNNLYRPDGTSVSIVAGRFAKTVDGTFVPISNGIFVKTINNTFAQVYPSPKIVPMPLSTTADPSTGME